MDQPAAKVSPVSLTPRDLRLRRLEAEAYLNVSRIHRVIDRRVAELFQAEGFDDVTPAQANALMILYQAKEPVTARALAQLMSLSEVTVGRFVRALEAEGWVDRSEDPNDSRAMLIRPTAKAYGALPRLINISNALLDEAFVGFDASDVAQLTNLIIRIRENLEQGASAT